MNISSQNNFANLVEQIKNISTEDKEELRFLLDKYLLEEKRNEIYKNYKISSKEVKEKGVKYSNDINKLKEMLEQ